jgi:hypothetical protein
MKKESTGYGGSINLSLAYAKGINRGASLDISGAENIFNFN